MAIGISIFREHIHDLCQMKAEGVSNLISSEILFGASIC